MSLPWRNLVRGDRRAPAAPDIDDDEEEQPHDVDEVPIPRRGFETEMLLRGEMARIGPHEADDQEDRADQNVKAVETRRHIEGRAVVALHENERSLNIYKGQARRKERAQA